MTGCAQEKGYYYCRVPFPPPKKFFFRRQVQYPAAAFYKAPIQAGQMNGFLIRPQIASFQKKPSCWDISPPPFSHLPPPSFLGIVDARKSCFLDAAEKGVEDEGQNKKLLLGWRGGGEKFMLFLSSAPPPLLKLFLLFCRHGICQAV